ncbi:hypothetical protein Calag_1347 [Caldisphaera lagunensis DSM 15908]|uniref:Tetratricopeptide repeat protein n=1 Tax=Caldisphaera lagunensis (strain DSM 15908 / JCM 11604 / ANMR 0165 / IC-154) TaxID=1056495 RepID=L0AB01_CALLD|nr:hypothetical protein [Caldisphaera lagunensis]AFZ71056.1 hypothetical protein Calag_1347 [Caldisphaera lagunensis DSM 15908]
MSMDSEYLNLARRKFDEGIKLMNDGLLIQAANNFIESSNYLFKIKNLDEESRLLLIKSLVNQGAIMINLGRYSLAINSLIKSWMLLKNDGNKDLLKATYINLISAFIASNRYDEAMNFINKLEGIDEESKAYALMYKSKILIDKRLTNNVGEYLEEARTIFDKLNMKDQLAAVIAIQVEYYNLIGDYEKAKEYTGELNTIAGKSLNYFIREYKKKCN